MIFYNTLDNISWHSGLESLVQVVYQTISCIRQCFVIHSLFYFFSAEYSMEHPLSSPDLDMMSGGAKRLEVQKGSFPATSDILKLNEEKTKSARKETYVTLIPFCKFIILK